MFRWQEQHALGLYSQNSAVHGTWQMQWWWLLAWNCAMHPIWGHTVWCTHRIPQGRKPTMSSQDPNLSFKVTRETLSSNGDSWCYDELNKQRHQEHHGLEVTESGWRNESPVERCHSLVSHWVMDTDKAYWVNTADSWLSKFWSAKIFEMP